MSTDKVVITNRKAFHDFEIIETFLCGVSLLGSEVKSVRMGKANISDAWVDFQDETSAYLVNAHISPYEKSTITSHEPRRARKLLLKKKELINLFHESKTRGFSVVCTKILLKRQWIKVEVALARGKKLYDKREHTKEKEAERAVARAIRNTNN